jgi:hypothetical protein
MSSYPGCDTLWGNNHNTFFDKFFCGLTLLKFSASEIYNLSANSLKRSKRNPAFLGKNCNLLGSTAFFTSRKTLGLPRGAAIPYFYKYLSLPRSISRMGLRDQTICGRESFT